jgi:hypothetical protein
MHRGDDDITVFSLIISSQVPVPSQQRRFDARRKVRRFEEHSFFIHRVGIHIIQLRN